jgi:hypothetical protein
MGSAQAMAPALLVLKQEGWDVVTFAIKEAPALGVFEAAGLPTMSPSDTQIILAEHPDLVLVGISVQDDGSEKVVFRAALERGVPVAVIVESWPHRWLDKYGERDLPLYRQASLTLLVDEFSCEHMVSQGFKRETLVATGNPSQDAFAALKNDRAKHRREMRERFGIEENAILLMWSVALDLDDPAQDRPEHSEWSGFRESDSIAEFLEAMRDVRHADVIRPVRGVIRQKPSHGSTRVRQMVADICPEVIFDNGRETGNPLLLASDVVVGPVTMMVQNAAMLGIPGVFYLPDLCIPDPMIANTLGFTIGMYRRGDLRKLVFDAGRDADFVAKLQSRVRPIELPTDATEKVASAIRSFLAR